MFFKHILQVIYHKINCTVLLLYFYKSSHIKYPVLETDHWLLEERLVEEPHILCGEIVDVFCVSMVTPPHSA